MARSLQGLTIIITGASSGIGAATALACADAGMRIVLNARREDRLERVAAEIKQRGAEAAIVVGDVTEPGVTTRLLDEAERRFGGFDVVLANAGYGLKESVVGTEAEAWREMFEVNFFASVELLRASAKRLIDARRGGHLLMTSSCLSVFPLPYHAAYSATKAAQMQVCRAMRLELKSKGIYVSSVHPITTTTEFFRVANEKAGHAPSKSDLPDHATKFFVQTPERVAKAIVRCLRRPCPEVWTSHIVRTVGGVINAFPRTFDVIMRKKSRS